MNRDVASLTTEFRLGLPRAHMSASQVKVRWNRPPIGRPETRMNRLCSRARFLYKREGVMSPVRNYETYTQSLIATDKVSRKDF